MASIQTIILGSIYGLHNPSYMRMFRFCQILFVHAAKSSMWKVGSRGNIIYTLLVFAMSLDSIIPTFLKHP